jgi:hypothetical protein
MSLKSWIDNSGGMYTTIPKRGPMQGEECYFGRFWIKEEKRFRHFFLGTTLKAARIKRAEIYSDPMRALTVKREKKAEAVKSIGFDELVEKFLSDYRSRGESGYYAFRSKAWLSFFKGWDVRDIDFKAVEAFREARRAAHYRQGKKGKSKRAIGDSTLRKDLLSLSTLFRWAMRRRIVSANPVQDVGKAIDELTRAFSTHRATFWQYRRALPRNCRLIRYGSNAHRPDRPISRQSRSKARTSG